MPKYIYYCEGCGIEFVLPQKITDKPIEKHDKCGGKVVRIIRPDNIGIRFVGKGFAVNDL